MVSNEPFCDPVQSPMFISFILRALALKIEKTRFQRFGTKKGGIYFDVACVIKKSVSRRSLAAQPCDYTPPRASTSVLTEAPRYQGSKNFFFSLYMHPCGTGA
jgi:hypothetical protein